MTRRMRTLAGTFLMLFYVFIYALFAIMMIQSRVIELPHLVQTLLYLMLGLIWVVPLMPLLKWMGKNDTDTRTH